MIIGIENQSFGVHFEWTLKTVLTVDLFFLFAKPYVRQKTDLVSDLSLILDRQFLFLITLLFSQKRHSDNVTEISF